MTELKFDVELTDLDAAHHFVRFSSDGVHEIDCRLDKETLLELRDHLYEGFEIVIRRKEVR